MERFWSASTLATSAPSVTARSSTSAAKATKTAAFPLSTKACAVAWTCARRISSPVAHELRERIHMIRLTAANEDTETLPLTVDALRDWGWLY
jgi:hypothetical protein